MWCHGCSGASRCFASAFILLVLAVIALTVLGIARSTFADGAPSPTLEGSGQVLSGDTDCNGTITALDALTILRFVASNDVTDCLRETGNVLCEDGLDSVDALAVIRYVAGSAVDVPAECPAIGKSIFAPPQVSLICDTESMALDDVLNCRYSAESYFGDVSLSWNLGDGLEPVVNPAALGAECAPDGVPCRYSAWGPKTVAFRYPGAKTVALTGCANGGCVTQVWRLTVEDVRNEAN